MIIRNANGAILGTIEPNATERGEFIRALSSARQTLTPADSNPRDGYPVLGAIRRQRARLARTVRALSYASLAIVALSMVIALFTDDSANAHPSPVAPTPSYTAPVGSLAPAPYSGSTAADARDGWNGVEVDHNGYVLINGHSVDNVRIDKASPLRVRYLQAFDNNGLPRGIEDNTVREGIAFCQSLQRGDAVALREASDARADSPTYGTGARRLVVASASIEYFCPRFA